MMRSIMAGTIFTRRVACGVERDPVVKFILIRHRLFFCVLLLLLTTASCGPSETTPVVANLTLEELPAGVGRGYPVVDLTGLETQATDSRPGAPAPNFWLRTEDEGRLSLQDLQNRPILLNFWATWCGPCRLEMPEIIQAAAAHPDLVVLAINVQEELTQIQPFAEDFQMTIPVVRDNQGDLRRLYDVRGMPTSIFIDKAGKIATVWSGVLTKERLEELLTKLE